VGEKRQAGEGRLAGLRVKRLIRFTHAQATNNCWEGISVLLSRKSIRAFLKIVFWLVSWNGLTDLAADEW
jgi:hypothetical protein